MDPALVAHLEISSLLLRERYYRDTHQWTRLRAAWHPDPKETAINISWFQGDVDTFVARSIDMVARGTQSTHVLTPIETHFRRPGKDINGGPVGNKAMMEALGSITIRVKLPGGEYDVTSWARFYFGARLVPRLGWRFVSLESIYDRDSITPTCAGQEAAIKTQGHRESYKYLSWVLGLSGYSISDGLAGTDRPESVQVALERQWKWLDADD